MKRTPDKVVLRLYDEKNRLLYFHIIKASFSVRKGVTHWWTVGRSPVLVTYTPPTTTHVARATLAADSMGHVFGHPYLLDVPQFTPIKVHAESALTIEFGYRVNGKKQPLLTIE